MSLYGLNEVPLGGIQTFKATGQSSVALVCSGAALTASLASGSALLQIEAKPTWARLLLFPKGNAVLELDTQGVGVIAKLGEGVCELVFEATAEATPATLGSGALQIPLTTSGEGTIATLASGELSVVFETRQGILVPPTIPFDFRPSHEERHYYVPKDRRTF